MTCGDAAGAERGREAQRPVQLGLWGWRDALLRTGQQLQRDRVAMIAAGVAFFALLALFPAIAAAVSIWGLVFEPNAVEHQLQIVGAALPPGALEVLQNHAYEIAGGGARVGTAAIGGLVLALLAASRGMGAVIEGLNVAYNERESRNLLVVNATAVALTFFALALISSAAAAVTWVEIVVQPVLEPIGSVLLGFVLVGFAAFGLAVLYRFGPALQAPRWRWASAGAIAGVVVLLLWLWLSAFAVLLGAEINNELERQTRRDTTIGPPKPMGLRGAYGADTLGPTP